MNYESTYRYDGKKSLVLATQPTSLSEPMPEKEAIQAQLAENLSKLADLQSKLYAQSTHGVIVLLQGMDAAGKDSMIRHVMSGLDPEGTSVVSFKQPTSNELAHDYLWRISAALPRRGSIQIFNRSQYEDVLISRVHPEILTTQHLPGITSVDQVTPALFHERYDDIKHYETYLKHNGFVLLKFFLHYSKAEQKRRFEKRIEVPDKNWKFSAADIKERAYWDDYQKAYEEMLNHTATKDNPWYIIPSDSKWCSRVVVSNILTTRLAELNPKYPTVTAEQKQDLHRILEHLQTDENS
ncbi:polyphosphate kinase 2 family protein [Furfurilactobacillus sp. WILCCON 0119]|uniref:polyphosphate kinase 2 family protein n=1 Tax=Furfurilactobacillus entadae TaxID=2922307 RepID=UPI0035EC59AB